jgi:outer membrane receptor for ferrienterochelin and colicin
VTYADWLPEARTSWATSGPWGTEHLATGGIRVRVETLASLSRTIGSGDDAVVAPAVDADATQVSPFLQDEIFLDDGRTVSLVLGLSLDDHSNYGLQVNPRGTITYRFGEPLRVSFTGGRGYRAPDLLQLYDVDINNVAIVGNRVTGYAIVGNPNLEAETDLAFNLQADFSLLRSLSGTLTFYRHDFDNLIANVIACPTPTMCQPGFVNPFPELQGPIFTFDNVDSALTQGFDLGLRFFPLDYAPLEWKGAHSLELSVGYGFLDSENRSGIPNEEGKQLPFRPRNRVIPAVQWANSRVGTTLRVWGEFQDEMFTDLANTPEGRVGPHWFWNFKLTQDVADLVSVLGGGRPPWLEGVSVFAQGLNVLDEVVEAAAIAAQQRQLTARASFIGGVTYRFR